MKPRNVCPVLLVALFVATSFCSSFGQGCFNWMIPEYSTYTSVTTDGSHLYTSVLVDGTTGGTCSQQGGCDHCSQILNPPPMHTPKAYNTIGSTGGWVTGTAQQWNQYISEQNNQSIVASDGVIYEFQSTTEVDCNIARLLTEVAATDYTAESANCGKGNGDVLHAFVPAQSQSCNNGASVYNAPLSIHGTAAPLVTEVELQTSTDNALVIEVQNKGQPSANPLCQNKFGSTQWCYQQAYKAYSYPPNPKGNILWNVQVWCGGSLDPDIHGTAAQPFTCQ
jgi:hypothetical protein